MRIIAMLSYFDEDPDLLRACISRLAGVGVDLLVACDGPYDLYPSDKQASSFETVKAIIDSCGGAGKPDLILRNKSGWEGNEVEKRNYMLDVALAAAEEGDWLLVVDSDHMWELTGKFNLHDALERSEEVSPYQASAAEVAFSECALDEPSPYWHEARLLLRAVPGMGYEGAHYRVRFPDGRAVSTLKAGDQFIDEQAGIVNLKSIARVRHVVYHQPLERRERQAVYYEARDGGGVEA